jgi:hypothetical protein
MHGSASSRDTWIVRTTTNARRVVVIGLVAVGLIAVDASAAAPVRSALDDPAAFANPPRETRPKFRWWWGNVAGTSTLDPASIPSELKAIADAGFGGVEIAFNGGTWATATQRESLERALVEAKKLGLQIDMTLGAAWPFQTPNTQPGSGLSEQELMYGRTDVTGPSTFSGAVPAALDDANGQRGGKVIGVSAARVVRAGPAVTAGTPPSSPTVLDPDSLVDLTSKLRPDGTVSWEVPAGTWILFSYWQRDAEEGVIDHLSAASARAALEYVDKNQLGSAAGALPGVGDSFFEDSLELDVAELFWTPDFAAQFKARRGYEITRYLPLMFVQGMHKYWVPEFEPTPDFELPDGTGYRFRHDYYETETDLYVANHIDVIADWAKAKGMAFRSQVAFGNSFDVTRSAREIAGRGGRADDESLNAGDILPFSIRSRDWGFAFDHYRALVAGSHQGGSNEISYELGAVFLNELMVGLTDYKRIMDKAWAAGVTRPMIHGYATQPPGTPWPGNSNFIGLVSDSWNAATFPQWAMWKPLADYWGRGTKILQDGTPKTDVAIYRDGFSTTAATITGELPEIVVNQQLGDLPAAARQPINELLASTQAPRPSPFFDTEPLSRAGFTTQYLDPVGVRARVARGKGELFPKGPGYRALVLDTRWIPAATATALDRASGDGLAIVVVGGEPGRAAGGPDAKGDATVRAAFARILRRRTTREVARQDDVAEALADLGVRPAAEWSRSARVYTQRRVVGDTELYYLYNATDAAVRMTGSFAAAGAPSRLDLWTGEIAALPVYSAGGGRVRVPLDLAAGETEVVAFRPDRSRRAHVVSTSAQEVVPRGPTSVEVRGTGGRAGVRLSDGSRADALLPSLPGPLTLSSWSLTVDQVGPEGTTAIAVPGNGLGDWRSLPGVTAASGTGRYVTTVALPGDWAAADRGATVTLGRIEGAAQLHVNGRLASPRLSPVRPVDVTGLLKAGENTFEVVLTTTLKNRALSLLPLALATRPVLAAEPGTQPYGLFGPVRLAPFGRAVVDLPVLRRCASRRRVTVHVPVPRGFRVRGASVSIGGRTRRVAARRTGGRVAVVVDLRTRPKGTTIVKVRVTDRRGRSVSITRRYRLCTTRTP